MDNGRLVAPLSRAQIEEIAAEVREALGLSADGRVAMLPLLEQVLYEVVEGYDFRVLSDEELRHVEGLTDDQKPIIYLKNSVYLALERSDNRARMTAAHEFGHLLLHCGLPTYRAFSDKYEPLFDPERQANLFAAAFLMPAAAFKRCRTTRDAMKAFGVSRDAATCRARHLKHKFAPDRPILTVQTAQKKKGRSMRRAP